MFSWMNFLAYALVTAVTPGPNNIMSMGNAGRQGFRGWFPFNLGIWAGFSAVMLGCGFFCNGLAEALPKIKGPMLVLGAGYMLWLAYKTLKSAPVEEGEPGRGGFARGLMLQFVNPKIYIYGIVSMEAYILPFYQGRAGAVAFFALLLAFIGFACTLCWALCGSAFKRLFSKHARVVNGVMALALVYCAVRLFF